MTQHLNYCRQFVKAAIEALANPLFPGRSVAAYSGALQIARGAEKFLLPPGGLVLIDHEFRALDADMELRLPFPAVALEYENGPLRCILIAVEYDDEIVVQPIIRSKDSQWSVLFRAAIPTRGFLSQLGDEVRINVYPSTDDRDREVHLLADGEDRTEFVSFHEVPLVLMQWLNAMQCINVKVESSPARKQPKASKGALPFDSYHILTIPQPARDGEGQGGSHRAPREHLRRGHVRRLESGAKVWINATVVNPGVGGKVTKDYSLRGVL